MTGLIIDTSGKRAILALSEKEHVTITSLIDGGRGLSGRLFLELKYLLGSQIKNLSSIAVGTGPGSFAGTRTAVTIAKTLAFSAGLPVVGFPSPLAFIPPCIKTGPFAYLLDAKMDRIALVRGNLPSFEIETTLFKQEALQPGNFPIITDLDLPFETYLPQPNPSRIAHWLAQAPSSTALDIHYLQQI